LLFSATVPTWVERIARRFMKDSFKFVDMIKNQKIRTSKTVKHLMIQFPNLESKISAIGDILQVYGGSHSRTIIFVDKKK
jgi:ATP-dependent RNA helicase DDX21